MSTNDRYSDVLGGAQLSGGSAATGEGLKLSIDVDVDNLRTSLPPPSELSPVRPMALYRNNTGHNNRRRIVAGVQSSLVRKGSDPGLAAMFRSAATGGAPRTPPRTPPGGKRRELPKSQANTRGTFQNSPRTIVLPSGCPTRFEIGRRNGAQGTTLAPSHGVPPRLPTLVITRASADVSQIQLEGGARTREEGKDESVSQEFENPSSSAPTNNGLERLDQKISNRQQQNEALSSQVHAFQVPSLSDVANFAQASEPASIPVPQSLLFSEPLSLLSQGNGLDPRTLLSSSIFEVFASNTTACSVPTSASPSVQQPQPQAEISSHGFSASSLKPADGTILSETLLALPRDYGPVQPTAGNTDARHIETEDGKASTRQWTGRLPPTFPGHPGNGGDAGDFLQASTVDCTPSSDEIRSQSYNRLHAPSQFSGSQFSDAGPLTASFQLPSSILVHPGERLIDGDLPASGPSLPSGNVDHPPDAGRSLHPSCSSYPASQRSASKDGSHTTLGLSHLPITGIQSFDVRIGARDVDFPEHSETDEISRSEASMLTASSTNQEALPVRPREGDCHLDDKDRGRSRSINTRSEKKLAFSGSYDINPQSARTDTETDQIPLLQVDRLPPADSILGGAFSSILGTEQERKSLADTEGRPLITVQPSTLSSLSTSAAALTRSTSGTSAASTPPSAPWSTTSTGSTSTTTESLPQGSVNVSVGVSLSIVGIGEKGESGESAMGSGGDGASASKPKPKAFYSTDTPGPSSRPANSSPVRHRANTTPANHPYHQAYPQLSHDQSRVQKSPLAPGSHTSSNHTLPRTTMLPGEHADDQELLQGHLNDIPRHTSQLSTPATAPVGSSFTQSSLGASMASEAGTSNGVPGSASGRRPLPRPPAQLGGAGEPNTIASSDASQLPSSSHSIASTRTVGSSSQATNISSASAVSHAGTSSISLSTMGGSAIQRPIPQMFSPTSPKNAGPRAGPSKPSSLRQRPSPGFDSTFTPNGSASSSSQGSHDGHDTIVVPVPTTRGTLPTPPSSANVNSFSSHASLAPPSQGQGRLPPRAAPSPPPRPASRQAREHQRRQEQKKRRDPSRNRAGNGKASGSDVEGPPVPTRSLGHTRNGSVNTPQGQSGGGAKVMPMPLVLNSAILAPSSNSQASSTTSSFATPRKSPSASRTPSTSRTPSLSRTPTTGRRERSADSYLENKLPLQPCAVVGYRVLKQGAEEVMERAGRTMGPRAAAPVPSTTKAGRGRSSSAADLLGKCVQDGNTNGKPNVERGSILDLKQQHINPANVRSAPTSPRRLPLNIGIQASPPMFSKPPTRPVVEPTKRRPSVTLNTSFTPSTPLNNSQPASPITRVPLSRPLPVPGSATVQPSSTTSPQAINPAAVRAFRALPSPASANPTATLAMQMPTPSSTTSTHVRPLPQAKSKSVEIVGPATSTTTPTLPYAGPSSPPNRPFATPVIQSGSPKMPLSLSIPNIGAKNGINVTSPRMLPTPLTTTKDKQRDLDFELLSQDQSLSRLRAKPLSQTHTTNGLGAVYSTIAQVTPAEFSPASTTSTSDLDGSGNEGLHLHPNLTNLSNDTESDFGSLRLEIEDEIVFRDREEIEDDDSYVDTFLDPHSLRVRLDEVQESRTRLDTSPGTLNNGGPYSGWRHSISSPSDGKPISPIVVGKSTFNDVDEAKTGDPRHRRRQQMLDSSETDTDWDHDHNHRLGYQYDAYDNTLSRSPSPIRYARPDSRGNLRSSSSKSGPPSSPARSSRSVSPLSVRSGRSSRSTSRSSSSLSFVSGDPRGVSADDLELGFDVMNDGGFRKRVRRRKEQPRSYRHSYRAPALVDTDLDLGSNDGHRSVKRSALGPVGSLGGRGGSMSTLGSRDDEAKTRSLKRSTIKEVKDAVSRAFDFDSDKKGEKKEQDIVAKKLRARGGGVPLSASATLRLSSPSNPSSVFDISTPEIPPKMPKMKGKKSKLSTGSRPGTAESGNSGSTGKSYGAMNKGSGLWKNATSSDKSLGVLGESSAPFTWMSRRKTVAEKPVPEPSAFKFASASGNAVDHHRALVGAISGRSTPEPLSDDTGLEYVDPDPVPEVKKSKKRTASVPVVPFDELYSRKDKESGQAYSGPFSDAGHGSDSQQQQCPDSSRVSIKTRRPKSRNRRTHSVLDGWEAQGQGKSEWNGQLDEDEESLDVSQVIPKLRGLKSKSSKGSLLHLR